jgi:SWI/SNF-related matrix-associated actin-dependent regulator 1 of chromatin subfamily A
VSDVVVPNAVGSSSTPAVPSAEVPSLRPYQQRGVDFIVNTPDAMLADDAGLGKTVQAIEAARRLDALRILIAAPAIARLSWPLEIQKFWPQRLRHTVVVMPGDRPTPSLHAPVLILIVSYDVLSTSAGPWSLPLRTSKWDLLILDEAHYLKGPSNRTRFVYGDKGLRATAKRVLLLTGTPAPNHVGELYFHYLGLWPEALGISDPRTGQPRPLTEIEFQDRFCRVDDGIYGRRIVGSKNQATLRAALAPFVLRRRTHDVLRELPPLTLRDVPLDLNLRSVDLQNLHRYIGTGMFRELQALITAAPEIDNNAKLVTFLQQHDAVLAGLRRALGLIKAPACADWAEEQLINGTEKILLFAWHRDVIDLLTKQMIEYEPAVIDGHTSPGKRQEAINAFQTRRQCRVFIGQILAAGTAVTLHAGQQVGIVEPSWVPAENWQAIKRAHRIGQTHAVIASFLYAPGTIDEAIMRVMRRKAVELSKIFN